MYFLSLRVSDITQPNVRSQNKVKYVLSIALPPQNCHSQLTCHSWRRKVIL